jgi:hypothetical protein
MSFADQVRSFSVKVEGVARDVFVNTVTATAESITDGSALTGAPGQPVDTGALKASWQTVFESPTSAVIGTNLVYAPLIEDGISGRTGQPLTLRSAVGGFHSVALTVLNFDRIVENEAAKAAK